MIQTGSGAEAVRPDAEADAHVLALEGRDVTRLARKALLRFTIAGRPSIRLFESVE